MAIGKEKRKKRDLQKVDTFIGPGSYFKGDIRSDHSIRVEGVLEGTITGEGNVSIGEKGRVEGSIKGRTIMAGGEIRGNVTADEVVELLHTGRVFGDISTPKLIVAEGVIFEGNCNMSSNRRQGVEKKPDPLVNYARRTSQPASPSVKPVTR